MTDKNSIIGISLMVVLIVIYYAVFVPRMTQEQEALQSAQSQTEQQARQEALHNAEVESIQNAIPAEVRDSLHQQELASQYGDFASLMVGESETLTVKTDLLTLEINTQGGNISSATLNKHRTYDSLPLPIISTDPANKFFFEFVAKGELSSQSIKSSDLYFEPSKKGEIVVSGKDTMELRLIARLSDDRYVEQVYTFKGDKYDVGYSINLVGLRKVIKNTYYELNWLSNLQQTEKALTAQRQKSQIVYKQGDDVETLGGMSDDPEQEYVKNGIDWISFKSQFFSHAIIPSQPINSADIEIVTPGNESLVKVMRANMELPIEGEDSRSSFKLYMGPNEYYTLNSYKVDLEEEMDLGYFFISYINIGTIYIFKFMEKFIGNYGLIILLFAIMVKLIVFPMTYKSYVSMAKLRVINETEDMKALKEKYKDDAQKLQMETMAVYRKMGVSPLGGCLPMLLQYPILISMFFFFPQSIELRQKAFLWANDLSTYDSILELPFSIPAYGDHVSLFTLLMAVSIYVYTYFQQKSQPTNNAMPFMKYLPYFMPIIFVFFLNNYSSGLSWYYFAANIISIIQTTAIRARLDDEKLLAQLHANAKTTKKGKGKPGSSKPSKSRLEKWMEAQQKKQEDMKKGRKQSSAPNRRSRRDNK